MDRSSGASGLPLVEGIVLLQTDTTVGFASQSAQALARAKGRPTGKPFLKTYASLHAYKESGRIPKRFKREIRRSYKTTYIVKSQAFRIVSDTPYHTLLTPYGWLYSTSANPSNQGFDTAFAHAKADAVIEDRRGLFEDVPSNIYKLNQRQKRRIR